MDGPASFQQQLDILNYGEVHPMPFATDVERRDDLAIHVVLIDPTDGVDSHGHTSTHPIFSRRFTPAPGHLVTEEDVKEWRRATVVDFGIRLRQVLGSEELGGS